MAAAGLLEGSLGASVDSCEQAARVCQHCGVLCVGSAWHCMYVDKAGAAAAATAFGVLALSFSMWLRGQHNLDRRHGSDTTHWPALAAGGLWFVCAGQNPILGDRLTVVLFVAHTHQVQAVLCGGHRFALVRSTRMDVCVRACECSHCTVCRSTIDGPALSCRLPAAGHATISTCSAC